MSIFDHVQIKVKDYKKSRVFYEELLKTLGYHVVLEFDTAFGVGNDTHDMFEVSQADEERPLSSSVHLAFKAQSREDVKKFYKKALELGATDNGAPGLRDYEDGYFSAFVIDPDGHNLEAVCMDKEEEERKMSPMWLHWLCHALAVIVIGALVFLVVSSEKPEEAVIPNESTQADLSYENVVASIQSCDPLRNVLGSTPVDIEDNLAHQFNVGLPGYGGFETQLVCRDSEAHRVVQILSKPSSDLFCETDCEQVAFQVFDTETRDSSLHILDRTLGFHGELAGGYCLIDHVVRTGSAPEETQIYLYCGHGEWGGLSRWYTFNGLTGTLDAVQVPRSNNGGGYEFDVYDVLQPDILAEFRYRTNEELNVERGF